MALSALEKMPFQSLSRLQKEAAAKDSPFCFSEFA